MINVVSVIVPIYNIENEIERCILSIINQTYRDLEIILVDDGSTDKSLEICQKYANIDERIRVIHKENGGLVSARKAGIQAANGEYIAHIDGDDWVESEYIKTLVNATNSGTVDVVIAGILFEYENGQIEKKKNEVSSGLYDMDGIKQFIHPVMLEEIFPSNCSKLFRKELIFDKQMQVEDCVECDEDTVTVYPILLDAKSIQIIDDCQYHYVRRSNSLSTYGTKASVYFTTVGYVYETLKKEFLCHEYKKILMFQLEKLVSSRLVAGIKRYYSMFIQKYLFPYELVSCGSRVILYGAGAVGRDFYKQIVENHYCEIILWVDTNYDTIDVPYGEIMSPRAILNENNYDYVVVCVSHVNIAQDIIKDLKNMSVLWEKIVWKDGYATDLNVNFVK